LNNRFCATDALGLTFAGIICTADCTKKIVNTDKTAARLGIPEQCVKEHEEVHKTHLEDYGDWCTKDKKGCCTAKPGEYAHSGSYQPQPLKPWTNHNMYNAWTECNAYDATISCCKRLSDSKCVRIAELRKMMLGCRNFDYSKNPSKDGPPKPPDWEQRPKAGGTP
jgi:hypothetical protein